MNILKFMDQLTITGGLVAVPKKARGRGPSKLTRQQVEKAGKVPEVQIKELYDYWCSTMRPGKKRVPALDARRHLKVASAIADYGVDECKRAIDGCAASDFHMGRNKQNKRYDDLELIFRDQDHVERFLGNVRDSEGDSW
jgi:hypothetical protein